jgi:hypothetical protein
VIPENLQGLMMKRAGPKDQGSRDRCGIVMLVTLVLLVVLATLGYTLTSRVASRRQRSQYLFDYQAARYACDSGLKYALATLEGISPVLVSRPNEPDFSDVFYMTADQLQEYLEDWVAMGGEINVRNFRNSGSANDANWFGNMGLFGGLTDMNDANDINDVSNVYGYVALDYNDPNNWIVRGPYGPQWPYVTEPNEFEIGSAKVRIEIEDENAKYPIGWMLLDNPDDRAQIEAGFETFCDWMDVNMVEVEYLRDQLQDISDIRPFKLEFEEISKRVPVKQSDTSSSKRSSSSSRRSPRRTRTVRRFQTIKTSVAEQAAGQAADFSRLFQSPLIDTETLARPTFLSEDKKESALKYLGMWCSRKVNVNTAPRHVLEAAFMLGASADRVADAIIERRKERSFTDLDDLKSSLLGYSDSISKCEKYITTTSSFFTVKVTATSGVATTSAVIAVMKDAQGTKKVAVISG